jgi:hypothetical protein
VPKYRNVKGYNVLEKWRDVLRADGIEYTCEPEGQEADSINHMCHPLAVIFRLAYTSEPPRGLFTGSVH